MRAIDTNVIVRVLTADDAQQSRAARAAIEAGDIFIGTTVVLETVWVLQSGYGFDSAMIVKGLRGLFGLSGVTVEDFEAMAQALEWTHDGMDFADALHLARSSHCSAFLSFDRKLARRAGKLGGIVVTGP